MPLKIELKPRESIIVGDALITNAEERTRFYIDGNVPILREKFIMRAEEANTPSKRLYFVVLQMYLKKESKQLQEMFLEYVKDLQQAAPSLIPFINEITKCVLISDYYAAIKCAGKLVEKEKEFFGDFSVE
ncbi:MAG: flagellar biosynthesis repressor FlbT [Alphaproteobacteria bacterium]